MKTRYGIAVLAAALILSGCGKDDRSSKAAEDISKAAEVQQTQSSAADAVSSEASPAEESSQAAPEESVDETQSVPENAESVPDESTPEETAADYQTLLASISDENRFENPEGESSAFSELHQKGLANVIGKDKAYALVYTSGGAGMLYYDVYGTSDGGKTWQKGDKLFALFNGKLSSFAAEDGRLVIIDHTAAAFEEPPTVNIVSCSDDFELTVEENKTWFDELPFDKSEPFNAYAQYLGGNKLRLTVKVQKGDTEAEEPIFDDEIAVDPSTLVPAVEGTSPEDQGA